ncbi:MAG: Asp/Glu/hydantoin racemase [Clostridia bacterium]|jgi:Asp/Glu/hydantoin racemase|nr:Asp/Glu/hydantoin racemase [Clostridia bacterium]
MKRIALLHTVKPVHEVLPSKLQEHIKELEIINVIDDFLIKSIVSNGGITSKELKILYRLISSLESYEPDYIVSTCSSLSDAMDRLMPFFEIPLLKIDTPMLQKALALGENITILATAPTTIGPTINQLTQLRKVSNLSVNLSSICVPEAGKHLFGGDIPGFINMMIMEAKKVKQKDVIVLAQASMAPAKQSLEETFGIPVLESPTEFIGHLKSVLGGE